MGQLFRIYPLRKTLLLIKTKTGGRYSGVVCHRTTDRVPVPMMIVRGGTGRTRRERGLREVGQYAKW